MTYVVWLAILASSAEGGRRERASPPPVGVALDLSARPPSPVTLTVAWANDAGRGDALAAELEAFRPCVDEARAARGYAGGSFGLTAYLHGDGSLTDTDAASLDLPGGFTACAARVWPTIRLVPTGLDVPVGFVATVVIADVAARRGDAPRRAFAPTHPYGAPTLEPQLTWSQVVTTPPAEPWSRAVFERTSVLSDCLWFGSTEGAPGGEIHLTVRAGDPWTAWVSDPGIDPVFAECLGRWLSTAPPPPPGAALSATLVAGPLTGVTQ